MTTVREILFGDLISGPAGSVAQRIEEAAERLAGAGALPARPEATPVYIARAAMSKVADLLDFEISDVLVGAWRTRSALLKAANETRDKPDIYRQVTIQTYALGWDEDVDVDIKLNGSTMATVTFALSLDLEITALAVVVQSGHITHVQGGDGTVKAALSVRAQTPPQVSRLLASQELRIDLKYELKVPGKGIPLVAEASHP
ncbi:MAG: hypothetical protein QOE61_676 [Micromonosporaceae bacterium]|nr:hypothetical protein [Micromonosporaceae bacterium]